MSGSRAVRALAPVLVVVCLWPLRASALDWPGRAEAAERAYLSAESEEERARAVEAIGSTVGPSATAIMEAALHDPSAAVRVAACEALGHASRPDATSLLVSRLGDRVTEVRAAAAYALSLGRADEAIEPLTRLLADPESVVRVAAVEALATATDATAVQSLLQAVRDTDREVVTAALAGLRRSADRSALPAILARVDDPSREVALAAVFAAGELGGAEQTMQRLARYAPRDIAHAAIAALHSTTDPDVVRFLASLGLEAPAEDTRIAALDAVIATGSPAAVPVFEPLLMQPTALDTPEFQGVLDYFAASGPRGWETLRSSALRHEGREPIWRAWLQSGDPNAVRETYGRRDWSDGERLRMLRHSPLPEAFCSAWRLSQDVAASEQEAWAQWLRDSGATECVDVATVAAAWAPHAQLMVALALIEAEHESAAVVLADLPLAELDASDLRLLFDGVERASVAVRRALAASPPTEDASIGRELALVSLQLFLEGDDSELVIAEARLTQLNGLLSDDFILALRCHVGDIGPAGAFAPQGISSRRAWAVRAVACGATNNDALTRLSSDPVVAVAELRGSPRAILEAVLDDAAAEPVLRAQALLSLGERDPAEAAAFAERHLSSSSAILRAAAWSTALEPADGSGADALLRRIAGERSDLVRAVLSGRVLRRTGEDPNADIASVSSSGRRTAENAPHPRSVVLVQDAATGALVYDSVVAVVGPLGELRLTPVELNGFSVVDSLDARYVGALAFEPR